MRVLHLPLLQEMRSPCLPAVSLLKNELGKLQLPLERLVVQSQFLALVMASQPWPARAEMLLVQNEVALHWLG